MSLLKFLLYFFIILTTNSCSFNSNFEENKYNDNEKEIFSSENNGDSQNPNIVYKSFVIRNLTEKSIKILKKTIKKGSSKSYPLKYKKYCIKDIYDNSLCHSPNDNIPIDIDVRNCSAQ